jgi:hypothetical protein
VIKLLIAAIANGRINRLEVLLLDIEDETAYHEAHKETTINRHLAASMWNV